MFGKLFASMFDGSLRSKGSWEALVTFQQMIILANKHGEVSMTAEAISFRTGIPLEIIAKGIAELSKPDPQSRTPDEEGRRIVLVDAHRDWGWRIVNYVHYRNLRNEEERREKQAELMRRRRAKALTPAPVSNVSPVLAPVSDVSPGSKQEAVSSKQRTNSPEVEAVIAHYVATHPKRKPGDKDRAVIAKWLGTYTVEELNAAITGNANDSWHREKKKHDLSYVLRDNGKIDDFREKASVPRQPIVDKDGVPTPYGLWLTDPNRK